MLIISKIFSYFPASLVFVHWMYIGKELKDSSVGKLERLNSLATFYTVMFDGYLGY